MTCPTVSIGLPVYNAEKRIKRALNSVLSQDYTDFELIISDNASVDRTGLICESYAAIDKRICYSRNERNIGSNPNHNRVFASARGKYFAWFADDLEYLPGMLGRCVSAMKEANGSVVLLHPRCDMVDETGRTCIHYEEQGNVDSEDSRPHIRLAKVISNIRFVNQHYGLFVSEALRKVRPLGPYDMADFVLTAELAMLGNLREIPEFLVRRWWNPGRESAGRELDRSALNAWLDPETSKYWRILPNRERLAFEYLRSACCLPLKFSHRLKCLLTILPMHYGRTSSLGRLLRKFTAPLRHAFHREAVVGKA